MAENDFPRLPVIQDENLLAAIMIFPDESDYQSHQSQSADLKSRLKELITSESCLILYPTAKSFMGSAGSVSPTQSG